LFDITVYIRLLSGQRSASKHVSPRINDLLSWSQPINQKILYLDILYS